VKLIVHCLDPGGLAEHAASHWKILHSFYLDKVHPFSPVTFILAISSFILAPQRLFIEVSDGVFNGEHGRFLMVVIQPAYQMVW
jgi:hypothetical protein